MTATLSIVPPSVDDTERTRSIQRGLIEYQDGERALQATEQKTEELRQLQQRRRLELGRQLNEARQSKRRGEWLPYLEKLGIARQTANDWMREAGFVDDEEKRPANPDAGHLSSRVAAGIDKRPRKRDKQPEPDRDEQPEPDDDSDSSEPGADPPPRVTAKKSDRQAEPEQQERHDGRRPAPRDHTDEPALVASLIRDLNHAIAEVDNLADLATTVRGFLDGIDSMTRN